MNTLEQLVSPALLRALGWTLLHSLWQGALAAAVLAVALLVLRRHAAAVRYRAAAGTLAALVLLAAGTFGYYYGVREAPAAPVLAVGASAGQSAEQPIVAVQLRLPNAVAAAPRPPAWLAVARRHFDQNLPWLVLAWALGLLVMSLRLLGGLLYVRRLRRHRTRPLPAAWQARLGALAARAGLRRPVALRESGLVTAPLVVGHLRPLVLLPLGAVAGLPVACVEAILAHELAHVLRRDYLVNLLQTLAETVFFYHPAVWFIGQCLRAERENCCDDLATQLVGGDPLRLARALTALAEWSQADVLAPAPRLALAATGGRGSLLGRVRRLVQGPPARPTRGESLAAVALLLGGLGLLGTGVALAGPTVPAGQRQSVPAAPVAWRSVFSPTDTIKPSAVAPPPIPPVPVSPPVPAAFEAPEAPEAPPAPEAAPAPPRRLRRGRAGQPNTVVIEKDKKGRLIGLVVDGQPVEAATAKLSKADRRAGRQITVVPLPPAPQSQYFSIDYSRSDDGETGGTPGRWSRDFDQKLEHKLNKAAKKREKSTKSYVYVGPEAGRRADRAHEIHIDIDDAALNRLANNAVALGGLSLNLGLEAAAQGIEEARRELEATLRDPQLDANARRKTKQALLDLRQVPSGNRRLEWRKAPELPGPAADEARDRQAERNARRADLNAEQAERNAEQAAHNAETNARRFELQEQISRAQRELAALQRSAPADRAAGSYRGPQVPPAPPAPTSSTEVRDELRRDGLIGPGEKSFSFQLDDKGGRVNGRALTPAQAEKYRRLFLPAATGKGKTKSAINISVDER